MGYQAYRKTGAKLHTTAFSSYPPKGSKGEGFTTFILKRTREFTELGHRMYRLIEPALTQLNPSKYGGGDNDVVAVVSDESTLGDGDAGDDGDAAAADGDDDDGDEDEEG